MPTKISKRTRIAAAFFVVVGLIVTASLLARSEPEHAPYSTTKTPAPVVLASKQETIGTSVEGRAIEAYTFGTGTTHLLFVGGIHGGYEWNSVLLAYRLIDELTDHPENIPARITVTVIPSANPDGVYAVIGKTGRFSLADVSTSTQPLGTGRMNAHHVDLNRNFDCKWKPKSTWRGNIVDAGAKAFSEPETIAIRNFVVPFTPSAVVFFHSQSNAVYASECSKGILPETRSIMNVYARAAGYTPIDAFDAYEVTGDAEGWLASIGIPAITVELATHTTIEWEKNSDGIKAVFKYFSQKHPAQ